PQIRAAEELTVADLNAAERDELARLLQRIAPCRTPGAEPAPVRCPRQGHARSGTGDRSLLTLRALRWTQVITRPERAPAPVAKVPPRCARRRHRPPGPHRRVQVLPRRCRLLPADPSVRPPARRTAAGRRRAWWHRRPRSSAGT